MSGKILTIWTGDIVGNVLTRINEVETRHLPDSLSKVALAITGTRWNGPRFFGLRDKKDRPAMEVGS